MPNSAALSGAPVCGFVLGQRPGRRAGYLVRQAAEQFFPTKTANSGYMRWLLGFSAATPLEFRVVPEVLLVWSDPWGSVSTLVELAAGN